MTLGIAPHVAVPLLSGAAVGILALVVIRGRAGAAGGQMTHGRRTAANPAAGGIPPGGRLVFGSVWASGPIGLGEAGAPWWAVLALTAFLSILAVTAICVQTLIPQNSRDRLAWWRDRRRYQRR